MGAQNANWLAAMASSWAVPRRPTHTESMTPYKVLKYYYYYYY